MSKSKYMVTYRTRWGSNLAKFFETLSGAQKEIERLYARRLEAQAYCDKGELIGQVVRLPKQPRTKIQWSFWFIEEVSNASRA
jgi:hypothetical protein